MLIRQNAFIETGNKMLKGGLHCHTTRSDGAMDPGDCIRLHAENGYDFLSLTDHRYYNYATYAPETDVLIVPGMEIDANISNNKGMCFHTVSLGPDNENNLFRQDERVDSALVSDQSEFQPMVDNLRNHGNIAFYCHPDWSRTPARSFENIEGYFAMEIWNSGCAIETDTDFDNGPFWDEILVQSKKLNCVAVDDGHAQHQHCKGWVRVNAEKKVTSILDALKNGAFYSSCGPEIYDFCVEDNVASIKCSPCRMIHFMYGLVPTHIVKPAKGELLTEAKTEFGRDWTYIRAVVEDEQGRRAWTNPIWLK